MATEQAGGPPPELAEIIRRAKDHVTYARELGIREVLRRPGGRRTTQTERPRAIAAPGETTGAPNPVTERRGHEDPASALERLRTETIGDCRRCKLAPTRTQVVFGVGNPLSQLMFVGEAPGADEDAQGIPFVGAAGQLLTRIIEAMGLRRDDVYIANIIKCRPPGNRNPQPDEIASCEPFLLAQLEIIAPKVICALGTFAAQTLLKTKEPISRLRGRWHAYQGIPLMPTFHPAYLLRNPGDKKTVWSDVQRIMERLQLPVRPLSRTP